MIHMMKIKHTIVTKYYIGETL